MTLFPFVTWRTYPFSNSLFLLSVYLSLSSGFSAQPYFKEPMSTTISQWHFRFDSIDSLIAICVLYHSVEFCSKWLGVQYSKEDIYPVYCRKLFYQKFCSAEEQFLKYQPNTIETSMKYKLTTQALWFHYCTMKTPLNYEDIYTFCNVLFVLNRIRFSSVVVVTGLLAGELRNRGLNPGR